MRGRVAPANVAKASPRIVWPIHGPNPASRDQPATVLVVPDDFVDCAGRMPKRSRWPEGLATGSVGYRGLPPVPQPKIKDPPQGRVFYFGWDTRIRYARSQPPRFKDLQSSKSAMWEHLCEPFKFNPISPSVRSRRQCAIADSCIGKACYQPAVNSRRAFQLPIANAEVVPGRQKEVDWLHAFFADLCDGHIYTGLISDRQ